MINYEIYEDERFLGVAEAAWRFGLKWTLSEADVRNRIFQPKLIHLAANCSGSSVAGGTFSSVDKWDSGINTLTTGTFFVLSALLFEATHQVKYLRQARDSLEFLKNHLFLEGESRLLDSLDSTKCVTHGDQLPDNYGVLIEGLAIWYSISGGDSTVQTMLNNLTYAAIMNTGWQGEDGIIAFGPDKTGSIGLIHGLHMTYRRNATSSQLRDVIAQYLTVQYNAVVDLATYPGTNIYTRWIGPANLNFSAQHQTAALGVLLAATLWLPLLDSDIVEDGVVRLGDPSPDINPPVVEFVLRRIVAAVAVALVAIIVLSSFGRWSGKRRRRFSRMFGRMLDPGMGGSIPGMGGSIRLESDDEEENSTQTIPLNFRADVPQLDGQIVQEDPYPVALGGNADVFRGTLTRSNGQQIAVAIKALRLIGDKAKHEETLRRMEREVRVWSQLKHPNTLLFLGVCKDLAPWPLLVSPFYKLGHVSEYLKRFPEADRHDLTLGAATGLTYLHRRDMIHGDLKVQNVLVDAAGRAVICDFGLSKILDQRGFTTNSVGTLAILAPELFTLAGNNNSPRTTKATDIYAFGLLALEIYSGEPPKRRPKTPAVTEQMLIEMQPRRDDVPENIIPPQIWALLERCWNAKLRLRPSMTHVLRLLETFEHSRTRQRKRIGTVQKSKVQESHLVVGPSTAAGTPNTTYMCRFDRPQSCTFEVDDFIPTEAPTPADRHTLYWAAEANEWAPMEESLTPRISNEAERAKYAEAIEACKNDWAWDDAEPGLGWLNNDST
ncbi:kinase-like domain-containing protein [Mycena metata]|uniref:Kinase-like domain-containing protein n=1 Tax=Mycena metata TaxID=1033252 RepID=A0AAD7I8C7_9AGAR|nr:kinase-like domain-containing protein [Mycena metata]